MKVLNNPVVLGLASAGAYTDLLNRLELTVKTVLGATDATIADKARAWGSAAGTHDAHPALKAAVFATCVELQNTGHPHQFGAGLRFYKPMIFDRVPGISVANMSPEEIIDELPGPQLRAFMLYTYHLAWSDPGYITNVGRVSMMRGLLPAYVRMVGMFRRGNVIHARELETAIGRAMEAMLRPMPYPNQSDIPYMQSIQEFGALYARIADEYLNDVALKFYSAS